MNNHLTFKHSYFCILLGVCALVSCRRDPVVIYGDLPAERHGFYLLCEGNMGANKATIDFFDLTADTLYRNIYPTMNPSVVMELGDVGNDIAIYGGKMYAVINCSGKVEVMDRMGKRITQVDIPNCRSLCFHDGYAYVSSYAGPVKFDVNYEQRGYVAKIDTASLCVVDTCQVGFQPEGMAVVGDKLYVANSGGYMYPNYDSTLSVIPLSTFREDHRIPVAINLNQVLADEHGGLYVVSRGDYYSIDPQLFYIDATNETVQPLGTAASVLCHVGDSLYYYADDYSMVTFTSTISWGIINTLTREIVTTSFITDSVACAMEKPYGIWVDPTSHDIFVSDALDYVTPGRLYHFSPDGLLISTFRTGDIPGHFAGIK